MFCSDSTKLSEFHEQQTHLVWFLMGGALSSASVSRKMSPPAGRVQLTMMSSLVYLDWMNNSTTGIRNVCLAPTPVQKCGFRTKSGLNHPVIVSASRNPVISKLPIFHHLQTCINPLSPMSIFRKELLKRPTQTEGRIAPQRWGLTSWCPRTCRDVSLTTSGPNLV